MKFKSKKTIKSSGANSQIVKSSVKLTNPSQASKDKKGNLQIMNTKKLTRIVTVAPEVNDK